jgi:hypothetical protein
LKNWLPGKEQRWRPCSRASNLEDTVATGKPDFEIIASIGVELSPIAAKTRRSSTESYTCVCRLRSWLSGFHSWATNIGWLCKKLKAAARPANSPSEAPAFPIVD